MSNYFFKCFENFSCEKQSKMSIQAVINSTQLIGELVSLTSFKSGSSRTITLPAVPKTLNKVLQIMFLKRRGNFQKKFTFKALKHRRRTTLRLQIPRQLLTLKCLLMTRMKQVTIIQKNKILM